jgi:hypothetical protein
LRNKKTAAFLLGERGGFEYKLPADCDWMRRCEKGEGLACFCTSRQVDPGPRVWFGTSVGITGRKFDSM